MRKKSLQTIMSVFVLSAVPCAKGQSVDPFYSGAYSLRSVTNLPGVSPPYGGVIIRTNSPNTLLIAGGVETPAAKIYQLTLQRGADGHITNCVGPATVLASTPGFPEEGNPPWTGLSGDWDLGPGGVLFYISLDNYLGQIKPGFTDPSKQTDLVAVSGITAGTVVSVPAGLPGAGRFKLATRNHEYWYDVPLTSDGAGTYNPGTPTAIINLPGTQILGASYVPAGSPKFTNASVVICDADKLRSYEVNSNGDPVAASGRVFVTGLDLPDGISRDPLTGDFLFVSGDTSRGLFILGNLAGGTTPTVTLIEPTNGAVYVAPAQYFVGASASAPGGTVANVKFYQNGTLLNTVLTPPYETLSPILGAGYYTNLAVITDGVGRMATSGVVLVTVTNPAANNPPVVSLTNPAPNSVFQACRTVLLSAVASDTDGYVQTVAFYDGGILLGQATNAPFRWAVNNLAGGLHALTAQAVDDDGARRTSSVLNITIVAPPTNTLVASINTNGQCEACFTGAPGSNYVFWGTTNLNSPIPWRRVETNSSPTGLMRFVDPSSTNKPRGFYRAEMLR